MSDDQRRAFHDRIVRRIVEYDGVIRHRKLARRDDACGGRDDTNLKVGKPDVAPDAPSHVPGIKQGNSRGNYKKQAGHLPDGRVTFLGASEYRADDSSHLVTSRVSGDTVRVDVRRRVVDATYLSPTIPATTPPPFDVADDVDIAAIN